jgi:hypothetical protein
VYLQLAAVATEMTQELQAPLTDAEQAELVRLLRRLIGGHDRS